MTSPKSEPSAAQTGEHARRGLILGTISAIGYSAANLALRGLSGRHEDLAWAIWVSAMKALPTAILAVGLSCRRRWQGQPLVPSIKAIPVLIVAALVMQFGGNLGFQVALGHIGLAITVPLVFAFIICAGAVLGKTFLGDRVSPRTVVSIGIMTVSIILLSYAATLTAGVDNSGIQDTHSIGGKVIWLGIGMAVISGLSYGVNGVVIRRVAQHALPIETMLMIYSLTGLICFGTMGPLMLGPERLQQIRTDEWQMMIWAGIFNAIAFLCITHALKVMNISQVNVINASQNAMCAVAAVLVFAEPVSWPLVLGIALSVAGLMALDRK